MTGNQGKNRITQKFAHLAERGEKALITFITAGDPDLETTRELVLTLEQGGADIIELGVPYSDPLADGPVIQMASQRALKSGTNLSKIFQTVADLRNQTQIPIILMTYYNPLMRYGLAKVADDAAKTGVDGFIVPDLPMEEAAEFSGLLTAQGVHLIPLVAPTSGAARIRAIAGSGDGFIYCVSQLGVTGVRTEIPENIREFMEIVRTATDKPLAVGFGISTPEQAAAISEYCDAVIVGSALVKTIGEKGKTKEMTEAALQMTGELKKPLRA
ncbi:MAG: tryptophan synthase subunit alpha [Thermincola sp.]|jgi:tryptophan synthase alpha chain|nr:tryptophan synthase subunit alpha [Thermincola sp.]MDT3703750.1 tryptophan synthase subunit alpha [Thermincola sp.]